jgi:hypothetical protein
MRTIDDITRVTDLSPDESVHPRKGEVWRVYPWAVNTRGTAGFQITRMFRRDDTLYVESAGGSEYPVSGSGAYVIQKIR